MIDEVFALRRRGLRIIAPIAACILLVSCEKNQVAPQNGDGISAVRSALVVRNYAEAADLARKLVTDKPRDPAANFELARAEALLGNEGRALDALGAAIDQGLPDAARALDDSAFSAIRSSDRFAAIRERAAPKPAQRAASANSSSAGPGSDAVQIRETSTGTHIQAGDVSLDTDF